MCLQFSSGVSVNISTEAAIIWKLSWGWRSFPRGGSLPCWFLERRLFPPTCASPRAPWVSSWHSRWSFPKYVIWIERTEVHADAHPFLWTSFYILFIRTKSLKLAHIQREGLLALHFEGVSVKQFDTLCVFPMPSLLQPWLLSLSCPAPAQTW